MQKVKVTRYISGRRPEWAEGASESESSGDEEEGSAPHGHEEPLEDIQVVQPPPDEQDRRLRRLKERGVLEADRCVKGREGEGHFSNGLLDHAHSGAPNV